MVFNSIFFIFSFLPLFLLIYYLVPQKHRNLVLFVGSLIFYAWDEPVYLFLMIFSSFFHYFMGIDLGDEDKSKKSKKRNLVFTLVIDLLILGFFKYYGFLLDNLGGLLGMEFTHPQLPLPIGISFYTFKNLSYVLDVYKGRLKPQKNFLLFGVYSTMFPHMAAGPIVRYTDIQEQLSARTVDLAHLGVGAEIFIKGLAKKAILADNLAVIYASVSASAHMTALSAWIGIFAYTMQLYFDFSGYSDMAIGIGKMLGFDFRANFDYPYISTSVSEFWRRWHISLGSWFRDYVYIPLGGNRVSPGRHVLNILIVWGLTGMWHGASWNFLIWGLYYGLLLLLEKFVLKNWLKRIPPWAANLYTMLLVMIGWVFFSQTDFGAMGQYFLTMIGFGGHGIADMETLYYLKSGLVLFLISSVACRPGLYQSFKRLVKRNAHAAAVVNGILFLLSVAYMIYNSYTPFLYMKF